VIFVKKGSAVLLIVTALFAGILIGAAVVLTQKSDFMKNQPAESVVLTESEPVRNGLVNINSAGIEELTTLPNIGESKAEAIIRYRDEHGYFISIDEIKNVSGIGDVLFETIKDHICA